MSARGLLAWVVVVGLGLAQFAVLAGLAALLLAAQPWPVLLHMPMPAHLAVCAAAAVGPGGLAALALWRVRGFGLLAGLFLAPLLLLVPLSLPGEVLPLVLQASRGLAIGTACGLLGLRGVDPGLLRAARISLSPLAAIRRVILPLLAPALVAAALLSVLVAGLSDLLSSAALAPLSALAVQPPALLLAASATALLFVALTSLCVALLRPR